MESFVTIYLLNILPSFHCTDNEEFLLIDFVHWQDFLGRLECTLGEIVGGSSGRMEAKLQWVNKIQRLHHIWLLQNCMRINNLPFYIFFAGVLQGKVKLLVGVIVKLTEKLKKYLCLKFWIRRNINLKVNVLHFVDFSASGGNEFLQGKNCLGFSWSYHDRIERIFQSI